MFDVTFTMKRTFIIAFASFFLLAAGILSGCGPKKMTRQDLMGKWKVDHGEGEYGALFDDATYMFGEDSVFFMNDGSGPEPGQFSLTDSTLVLDYDAVHSEKARFKWHQEEEMLVWEHQEIDQVLYLKKVGSE